MERKRAWAAMLTGATLLPSVARAQQMQHDLSPGVPTVKSVLKGRSAVDIMPGARRGLGYPLRFGNVVPGSVRLEVDGRQLAEGRDYSVDYVNGTVFVSASVRDSSAIRVAYRHDPSAAGSGGGTALPIMSLNFGADSQLRMVMGFNGATRTADGKLLQSNSAGLQNNLSYRTTTLKGVFMVSHSENARLEVDGASLDRTATTKGVEGTDRLILQSLQTRLGGATFSADVQDVGSKFTGFSMLAGSGYTADQAKQLEKEKGLKRFSLGYNGDVSNGLSFANTFRTIQDGGSKITYQNYGVKAGGAELYFTSRDIDRNFSRFRDIAEADRDQLAKERGITRESMGGRYNFAGTKLSYDHTSIFDNRGGIYRQSLALESDWLAAHFKTQAISHDFLRANDLIEGERGQWAKERGIERQSFDLSTGKLVKGFNASVNQRSIEDAAGAHRSSDFAVTGSGFAFEYWSRSTDASFQRLPDLSQPELDAMIQQTLRMYDPKAGVNGNDRGFIVREAGLDRQFFRASGEPVKGLGLRFEQGAISSNTGDVSRTTFALTSKNLSLDYRRQNIDAGFTRGSDLLEAERKLFGLQRGFDRQDFALTLALSSKSALDLSFLDVESSLGGASRWNAGFKMPGLEFRGSLRSVDSGFTRAGEINDPEHRFFSELRGYRQFDAGLKYDGIKGLKIDAFVFDADNGDADLHRYKQNASVVYAPNNRTRISLIRNSHRFDGANGQLYENTLAMAEGFQDFGSVGKLTYRREQETYGGVQSNLPDRVTDYAKYETKLGKSNDFSTEQIYTRFSDGGFEDIQTYKFGWQINKRFGVNVTEIFVNRNGDKPDLRTRAYGLTYDFGHNLKLAWSWHRDLNSEAAGRRNYSWSLTNGSLFGFDIGGGYDEKRWDGTRTHALGRFAIANPKPFNLWFMKGMKLQFGYDSEADNGLWKRENKLAGISFNAFGSGFEAGYSHITLPNQLRAADRTFKMSLDPTGKKPLQANLSYKLRTLPGGIQQQIRAYDVSFKLGSSLTLTHGLNTHPEKAQNGAPLNSIVQPVATNKWAIKYQPNRATSASFGFDELRQFDQRALTRRLNAGLTLFEDSGSPLKLLYSLDQVHRSDGKRFTAHRYEIEFEQRPGINQSLSLGLGYTNWLDGIGRGEVWNQWHLRLDYQLRF